MDTGRKEKSSSVHFEMPTRERPADLSGRDHDVHALCLPPFSLENDPLAHNAKMVWHFFISHLVSDSHRTTLLLVPYYFRHMYPLTPLTSACCCRHCVCQR